MKILVFGHKGMLGAYVYAWFKSKGHDVVGFGRDQFDASKIYSTLQLVDLIFQNGNDEKVIAINCIGTIKPRVTELGDYNAIKVNSIFPWLLASACDESLIDMIHITTDCVYSGLKGNYNESDPLDPADIYGLTKAAGEPSSVTVIRTSIIGEELGTKKRSLIEFVKGMEGQRLNGYRNHYWNGVTCLQLAKIIENMIITGNLWKGVRHVHSNETITKCALVKFLAMTYLKDFDFSESNSNERIDRSLKSKYEFSYGIMPDIFSQIEEQKSFYNTLKLYYHV
jgi:dTDP-4-dehydrorhamnose reductase